MAERIAGDVGVFVRRGDAALDMIDEAFSAKDYEDDPDQCRFLAWRNDVIDRFNHEMRLFRYGDDAANSPFLGVRSL